MTNDTDASTGVRRNPDPVFVSVITLSILLIVAVGIYLVSHGWSTSAAPLASMPAPNQSQVPSSPGAQPTGPTKAGAVALVEKSFRLGSAGKFGASCALESPAYLKFDAQHYAHGSCEAESRSDATTLASQGLSMQLTSTKVVSYAGGKATILLKATVGARVVTEHIYVRYHAGRWWMTGADDSGGDLGF
jgi:hypothetical protein